MAEELQKFGNSLALYEDVVVLGNSGNNVERLDGFVEVNF